MSLYYEPDTLFNTTLQMTKLNFRADNRTVSSAFWPR